VWLATAEALHPPSTRTRQPLWLATATGERAGLRFTASVSGRPPRPPSSGSAAYGQGAGGSAGPTAGGADDSCACERYHGEHLGGGENGRRVLIHAHDERESARSIADCADMCMARVWRACVCMRVCVCMTRACAWVWHARVRGHGTRVCVGMAHVRVCTVQASAVATLAIALATEHVAIATALPDRRRPQ
jgi:hypothetical protein